MIKQGLHQKLLQRLSRQQIQFIKLLQVNTVDLKQRIEEELMENPALLTASDADASPDLSKEEGVAESELSQETAEEENISVDEYIGDESLDVKDYVNDDYDAEGFHLSDEGSGQEERKENPLADTETFHEQLLEQFNAIADNEREKRIGSSIFLKN